MKTILIREIRPVIRGANFTRVPRLQFGPRYNYATQFFYLVKGLARAEINGKVFDLQPGDLVLYGPGDEHCLTSRGTDQVTFSTLNFSWNNDVATDLSLANKAVENAGTDYFAKADLQAQIEKLPMIPFKMQINQSMRVKLENMLSEIGVGFSSSDDLFNLRLTGLLIEVFHLLISSNSSENRMEPITWIQRFNEYLEENFADHDLDRKQVSKALGISESYLTALLRKQRNTNFSDSLTSVRMAKAMDMLNFTNLSVKEIAVAVGFANYSYFVSRFHKTFNRTPGSFKK